ncbi:hypothetical protein HHK36_023569 [Tetracentron sinense]|uniref:Uncharacterized protein n=1 Tax=Tetracentron sinense TaxID=13715 RepID=A0A834YSL8_TETSI|nr:hypothetical protein HHK36_023569 [Tetracentron sinense]
MANSTAPRVSILFIVIFLALAMSSEARIYRGFPTAQKSIDSRLLFRILGFDVSEVKIHERRSMLDANFPRVSPAGPDPQHNTHPPASD